MYNYTVEFVLESAVILTHLSFDEPDLDSEIIIQEARQNLMMDYKIDPEVLYLQDVIVHEMESA